MQYIQKFLIDVMSVTHAIVAFRPFFSMV